MSDIESFLNKIADDENLKDKLTDIQSFTDFINLGKKAGFSFTVYTLNWCPQNPSGLP